MKVIRRIMTALRRRNRLGADIAVSVRERKIRDREAQNPRGLQQHQFGDPFS